MSDLGPDDAAVAADVILPLIRRVAPGELTKSELIEQAGLDNDELRAGLARLTEGGKIREGEDGYIIAGATGASEAGGAPEDDDEDDDAPASRPRATDAASPISLGDDPGYKAIFEVSLSFGGTDDEAAMRFAGQVEEEIADFIHEQYPQTVVSAEVKGLLAYRPRVIFGGEDAADPTT